MKAWLFILLWGSFAGYASERHILMVSDSRGNCAFAHQMMRHFYSLEKSSFRMVSVGGSSPSTWMNEKTRINSNYGLDVEGTSEHPPASHPKVLALKKITTPFFPDLLQMERSRQKKFLTIINMGTNAYSIESLKKAATKMIQEVHAQDSSCVWVSPPHSQKFSLSTTAKQTQAIKEAIEEAGPGPQGKRCKLINSLEITNYPFSKRTSTTDGVHYCWHPKLIELGHNWADEAFEQIRAYFIN
jgi:hypothetical protein